MFMVRLSNIKNLRCQKKETKYSAKYIDKTLLKPNKKIYKTLFTATDKCQSIYYQLIWEIMCSSFLLSPFCKGIDEEIKINEKQGKISNNLLVTIQ